MTVFSKWRGSLGLVLSVGIHLALAMLLIALPKEKRLHFDTVNLTVSQTRKAPPPPPPEPEKTKVEEEKAVAKKKPKAEEPPPPPPPEEKPPEQAKEEPPVFDLGDNTFAANGQGAGWSMNRSEGNSRFGAVAEKNKPSVRGTAPKFAEKKAPSGTGTNSEYTPVPLADLAKRPEPVGGMDNPPYPEEARKAGIEGPVVLRVLIDKTGRVRKTQVLKSPSDILTDPAKVKIAEQLFTPALDKSGKPVDTVIVWTFRFTLDG